MDEIGFQSANEIVSQIVNELRTELPQTSYDLPTPTEVLTPPSDPSPSKRFYFSTHRSINSGEDNNNEPGSHDTGEHEGYALPDGHNQLQPWQSIPRLI